MKAIYYPDIDFNKLYIPSILKEIYIDGIYNDVFKGEKDLTIIDAGANIGLTAHYMRQFGTVYAIEPEPVNFAALEENRIKNKWDNVRTFKQALSTKDGVEHITLCTDNATMHSTIIDPDNRDKDGKYHVENVIPGVDAFVSTMEYKKKIPVEGRRIDTFMDENGIGTCDFLKLDIEGAEEAVLRSEGFKRAAPRIEQMMVEFHFESWPNTAQYVTDMGYEARKYNVEAVVILFTRT